MLLMIVFNNSEDVMDKSAVIITYNTIIFEKEQTTMGLIFWTLWPTKALASQKAAVMKGLVSSRGYQIKSAAGKNIPRDLQFTPLLRAQSERLGESPPR